tara:strand:- start:81 stop:758 length:678 start_codon:yes stop_codon:yes gene_type:complete
VSIRLSFILLSLVLGPWLKASDSLPVYRQPSSELIVELEKDRDLQYQEYSTNQPETLGQKILAFLREYFGDLVEKAGRSPISKVILIFLGVLLGLYILYRIIGPDRLGIGFNERYSGPGHLSDFERSTESLEGLMLKAEQAGDWREFIRLQFLIGLKNMQLKGHLKVSPQKTALDYQFEIRQQDLALRFKHFSRTFEYVWFGGFDADEDRARAYQMESRELERHL